MQVSQTNFFQKVGSEEVFKNDYYSVVVFFFPKNNGQHFFLTIVSASLQAETAHFHGHNLSACCQTCKGCKSNCGR